MKWVNDRIIEAVDGAVYRTEDRSNYARFVRYFPGGEVFYYINSDYPHSVDCGLAVIPEEIINTAIELSMEE